MLSKSLRELNEDTAIETGIDYLDKLGAVAYGKNLVFTSVAGGGKTTEALQIAINLGVLDNKKVLYLSSKKRHLENELMFLRMVTEQLGNELCHMLYKKYFSNKLEFEIADKFFDPMNVVTVAIVATALENCKVNFMSINDNDFSYVEQEIDYNDYDVVIIDSAFQLHQDAVEQMDELFFCIDLCKKKHSEAFIITAPLSYKELQNENDITLADLEASFCGKHLSQYADTIIALKTISMCEEDESKHIEVLKKQ